MLILMLNIVYLDLHNSAKWQMTMPPRNYDTQKEELPEDWEAHVEETTQKEESPQSSDAVEEPVTTEKETTPDQVIEV